jgi:O-antigen/teichoic acid export membrane protein
VAEELDVRRHFIETDARLPPVSFVARGGMTAVAGLAVSAGLQAVLVVMVTRGLGVTGTGVFFEAVALFTILSNIGELGADAGIVRTISRYLALGHTQDVRRSLVVALVPVIALGSAMACVLFVLALQLVRVFFHSQPAGVAVELLRYLIPFLPLASALTVMLSATRGFGSVTPYVVIQNIGLQAGRCLLVYLSVFLGLGIVYVCLGWIAPLALAFFVTAIVLLSLVRRAEASETSLRSPPTSYRVLASEFWRFASPRAIAAVFGITIAWLDVLLVGALRSTAEAGVYAAVSRISIVGALVLDAVGMAIAPQASSLIARGRVPEAEAVYSATTAWLIALTWPLYLTLATFAPTILLVLGKGFGSGQTALVILSVAQAINLATGNVLVLLLMAGKSWMNLVNAFVALAVNIGVNLVLIPRYGMNGAAVAWAVSIIGANLAALVEVKLLLGIRPFARGYWIAACAALGVFGFGGIATRLLFGSSVQTFVWFVILASIVYLILMWSARQALNLGALANALPTARAAGRS